MLYFIQIIISKNINTVILYTAEIRRLKSKIAELRTRCSQLENTTVDLSRQVKKLTSKNHFLAEVNETFANENDELRDSVDRYATYRLPKSFRQQELSIRRQRKNRKVRSRFVLLMMNWNTTPIRRNGKNMNRTN